MRRGCVCPLDILADEDLDEFVAEDVGAYSISKIRTSPSPAAEMMVRSSEWGINFTENIFSVWPVSIRVFKTNSGVVVCMLICVSSLPLARRAPLRDQL